MTAEQEQSTTTLGSRDAGGARVTVLRWVYPRGVPVAVLAGATVVIGRDPSCQVRLDTPRVSRRHAEVKTAGGTFTVRDLNSKNGVAVNGARVPKSELAAGDVLRLGSYVAVVESVEASGLPGFRDLGHGIHGGAVLGRLLTRARGFGSARESMLLQGEHGTGKELFARAVHRESGRKGPFVTVVEPSLDATELESALSTAGTLYVRELASLAPELQAALLSVMERERDGRVLFGSSVPLGSIPSRRLHVELRARLEEHVVTIPPLRERRADIVPLLLELWGRRGDAPKLDHELVERLCLGAFPANVLELEALAERLLPLGQGRDELDLADLAEVVGAPLAPAPPAEDGSPLPRRPSAYPPEQVAALKQAIERHGGNLTKAATELGITRPKAYRMLWVAEGD